MAAARAVSGCLVEKCPVPSGTGGMCGGMCAHTPTERERQRGGEKEKEGIPKLLEGLQI